MKTVWYYQTLEFPVTTGMFGGLTVDTEQMMATINKNAQNDWELVSTFTLVSENSLSSTSKVYAVMRRPMGPPPTLPS
ncbi:MAG: DUF4177 domain-containing protein [Verrucomicrobia bacterium]|nr:DUF4177 domain-containing protein [Verrucomicrobiota bacterium]